MEWRVPGGKVLPSWRKSDSCVMNRPSHHRRNKTGFGMICSQMSMDESCGLGSERYAER